MPLRDIYYTLCKSAYYGGSRSAVLSRGTLLMWIAIEILGLVSVFLAACIKKRKQLRCFPYLNISFK